jgi:hypothetical protein
VKFLLTLIGLNIGMPLVLVLLDAKETNFSGFRGAVDQARLGFETIQKALRTKWHLPISRWKVRQWMAEDPQLRSAATRSGINLLNHHWTAPGWRYIEPFKDARTDAFRLDNLLTSPTRLQAEHGDQYEDIVNETIRDRKMLIVKAIAAAKEIKAETGVTVDYREVIHEDLMQGQVLQGNESGDAAAGAKKAKGTGAGNKRAARQAVERIERVVTDLATRPTPATVLNVHEPAPRTVRRTVKRDKAGQIAEITEEA